MRTSPWSTPHPVAPPTSRIVRLCRRLHDVQFETEPSALRVRSRSALRRRARKGVAWPVRPCVITVSFMLGMVLSIYTSSGYNSCDGAAVALPVPTLTTIALSVMVSSSTGTLALRLIPSLPYHYVIRSLSLVVTEAGSTTRDEPSVR